MFLIPAQMITHSTEQPDDAFQSVLLLVALVNYKKYEAWRRIC